MRKIREFWENLEFWRVFGIETSSFINCQQHRHPWNRHRGWIRGFKIQRVDDLMGSIQMGEFGKVFQVTIFWYLVMNIGIRWE